MFHRLKFYGHILFLLPLCFPYFADRTLLFDGSFIFFRALRAAVVPALRFLPPASDAVEANEPTAFPKDAFLLGLDFADDFCSFAATALSFLNACILVLPPRPAEAENDVDVPGPLVSLLLKGRSRIFS